MGSIEQSECEPLIQPLFGRHLSATQMQTYIRLHEIGWNIYLINKPHSGKPTVVMNNNVDTRMGVIEQNGVFNVL